MTNDKFLTMIFGENAQFAYVTDFNFDPDSIPHGQESKAWGGGYYKDYPLHKGYNQYFCVSIFNPDENGRAKRRKANFMYCPVIVLDDVREKLDERKLCGKLSKPSIKIKTSKNSEQWFYILSEVCTDRNQFDNLMDGLIASDLAPAGNDPGMKGVTRLVRLPDGCNTKKKRQNDDGTYWQVEVAEVNETRYTMCELASEFSIDLNAPRKNKCVEGATDVQDHPLFQIGLNIKSKIGSGRYDITCPWVKQHTGHVDNGAAFFTNEDGSMGFKCHHGHCEEKTGKDLMVWANTKISGFDEQYKKWQVLRYMNSIDIVKTESTNDIVKTESTIEMLSNTLPRSTERNELAIAMLKVSLKDDPISAIETNKQIAQIMGWTKQELARVMKSVESKKESSSEMDIDSATHYEIAAHFVAETGDSVTSIGQFYVYKNGLWSPVSIDKLKNTLAKKYNEYGRCQRDSDYSGIAACVLRMNIDDDFFSFKPVGMAAGGRFYRVNTDGSITSEKLSQAHRRTSELVAPEFQRSKVWEEHLMRCFGVNSPEIDTLQEVFGACLFGLAAKMQKAVLFFGEPLTGKSTTMRILQHLVPRSERCSVSPDDWSKEYNRAALAGKMLNTAGDLSRTKVIPDDMFKTIQGDDTFSARFIFGRVFETRNTALHLFGSNSLPNTRDASGAFFRRWLVLHFNRKIERQVADFEKFLIADTAKIIGWALVGAQRLVQRKKFATINGEIMTRWMKEQNSVIDFIDDACKRGHTNRTVVYKAYVNWSRESCKHPFSKIRFYDEVERNGVQSKKINGTRSVDITPDLSYL